MVFIKGCLSLSHCIIMSLPMYNWETSHMLITEIDYLIHAMYVNGEVGCCKYHGKDMLRKSMMMLASS